MKRYLTYFVLLGATVLGGPVAADKGPLQMSEVCSELDPIFQEALTYQHLGQSKRAENAWKRYEAKLKKMAHWGQSVEFDIGAPASFGRSAWVDCPAGTRHPASEIASPFPHRITIVTSQNFLESSFPSAYRTSEQLWIQIEDLNVEIRKIDEERTMPFFFAKGEILESHEMEIGRSIIHVRLDSIKPYVLRKDWSNDGELISVSEFNPQTSSP